MTRFTAPLIALLLCGTTLAGCASDGGGMFMDWLPQEAIAVADAAGQSADAAAMAAAPSMDIDGAVRQAQSQRLAGRYDDAIHTLSQVMLIASDDPRVDRRIWQDIDRKRPRTGSGAVPHPRHGIAAQSEWSYLFGIGRGL